MKRTNMACLLLREETKNSNHNQVALEFLDRLHQFILELGKSQKISDNEETELITCIA